MPRNVAVVNRTFRAGSATSLPCTCTAGLATTCGHGMLTRASANQQSGAFMPAAAHARRARPAAAHRRTSRARADSIYLYMHATADTRPPHPARCTCMPRTRAGLRFSTKFRTQNTELRYENPESFIERRPCGCRNSYQYTAFK